jgi:hypothetical protein
VKGVCGTYAGYHKHLSVGMAPCEHCREAKRVYEADKRATRRTNLAALTHPSNTAWDAGCRCDSCKRAHDIRRIEAYGISAHEYDELLQSQGDGCAICGRTMYGARLHIDHDHDCCSGCRDCVRGLLCVRCNCWGQRKMPEEWDAYVSRPRPFAQARAS